MTRATSSEPRWPARKRGNITQAGASPRGSGSVVARSSSRRGGACPGASPAPVTPATMSTRVRRGALTRRFVVVARLRRALGHGALIGMSAVTTPAPPAERESTGLGLPIVLLGGAQFVMVL